MDPHELQLDVGAEVAVAADRHQRDAAAAFSYRVGLAPQIGEREPEQRVALAVLRRGSALLLVGQPRGVGEDGRTRPVAAQAIEPGAHDAPGPTVAVEGARRQGQYLSLLVVVQRPVEILVHREKWKERRGVDP